MVPTLTQMSEEMTLATYPTVDESIVLSLESISMEEDVMESFNEYEKKTLDAQEALSAAENIMAGLEVSIAYDNKAIEDGASANRLEASLEEYKDLLTKIGGSLDYSKYETRDDSGKLVYSLEEMVEEKRGILGKVSDLWRSFKSRFEDAYAGLAGVFQLASKFKTDRIKLYEQKLKSGELVPVKDVDEKKAAKLRYKFAMMYALGYKLSNGTNDIIEYASTPNKVISQGGSYSKTIRAVIDSASKFGKNQDIPRLKESMDLMGQYKIPDVTDDYVKDEQVRVALPSRFLGQTVRVFGMSQNPENNRFTTKNDSYLIPENLYKTDMLKPVSKEDLIKLATFSTTLKDKALDLNKEINKLFKSMSKFKQADIIVLVGSFISASILGNIAMVYFRAYYQFNLNARDAMVTINRDQLKLATYIESYLDLMTEKA